MRRWRKFWFWVSDDNLFLHLVENLERLVAKVLALAMVVVILVALVDLASFLCRDILLLHLFNQDIWLISQCFGGN